MAMNAIVGGPNMKGLILREFAPIVLPTTAHHALLMTCGRAQFATMRWPLLMTGETVCAQMGTKWEMMDTACNVKLLGARNVK